MLHERHERLIRIGYDGSRYERPEFKWIQTSFIQPQMMVQERYFYDPETRRYTVDRYLDDLQRRYGGIDAVLIWPTYPNLGIDNRNQLDMLSSMPGSLDGVRETVTEFHRRGVRVLFPMMMWDQGTRAPGKPWPDAIAEVMARVGADGVNGDTEDSVARAFPEAADRLGHPLVFQPELGPSDEALAYDLMTWGQYQYPPIPLVDRYKWLEPRHMVNISDRWRRDKTDNLQFALFNGIGWESWENIWGNWNQLTARDAEALRRVSKIERAVAAYLSSPDWEPYFPTLREHVFASRWPLRNGAVWTLVNRGEYDVSGTQLEIEAAVGERYFDLYHGIEITPELKSGKHVLDFEIEANGYGAILATDESLGEPISTLLREMRQTSSRALASFSHEWSVLTQRIVPIAPAPAAATAPPGMVGIPAGNFRFRVDGVEIEGDDSNGVDVQYPWENSPRRHHLHSMPIAAFWIDRYPVTNVEFKKFLDSTHYHPQDDLNYLRDWQAATYPPGWGDKPVTWVSLEDARAYARWAGKRLPHEWEWQYAAQGLDDRLYPWGNDWVAANVPKPDERRDPGPPDAVNIHPAAASPFGVEDLIGNVWQWTEEFEDQHTRAAILRGGSYYHPQGSVWYFPQTYKLSEHGKLLLMSPSMDRSAMVGFRCAMDVKLRR
jgi:gamma-glutamyl hercynylcysteine S-oxide synthase